VLERGRLGAFSPSVRSDPSRFPGSSAVRAHCPNLGSPHGPNKRRAATLIKGEEKESEETQTKDTETVVRKKKRGHVSMIPPDTRPPNAVGCLRKKPRWPMMDCYAKNGTAGRSDPMRLQRKLQKRPSRMPRSNIHNSPPMQRNKNEEGTSELISDHWLTQSVAQTR